MRKAFYKDNRMVPIGIMLLTIIIFIYHFELDRRVPEGISTLVPETNLAEEAREDAVPAPPKPTAEESPSQNEEVKKPNSEPVPPEPSAIPSSSATTAQSSVSHAQQQQQAIVPDDVVLMFKTGSSVLWKRVPIHLATTLSPSRINPNNVLLYSDQAETVGSWQFIDVLANTTDTVKKSEDFLPYRQQEDYDARQNYAEMSNMPGDAPGPQGGWKLDKYKFLPIVQHAGLHKPNAKWYIFMEDDSYIFLPNLVCHLQKFNPQDPWYLGSLAWIHGDYFAHGGSGFALSRGAWEQSFGKDANIVEKFQSFTDEHGCGDHILGHVLKEYGVQFGETHGDSRFTYGFNPDSHWGTWYEQASWCQPVYSWHHTHSKDVARFYNLEQSWDLEKKGQLRYRDIFNELVAPFLHPRIQWWDNWSSKHEIRSNNAEAAQVPETVKSAETWRKAWQSVDACEAACVAWGECVQWSFYEDRCKMDSMVLLGSGIPEGDSRRQSSLPWTSGWLKRRVENWKCDEQ